MQQIKIEEMMPVIKEVLDSGATFRFYPKGQSMLPTIVEKKDSVVLASPEGIGLYDAVLYRRNNGQFVLHRIVAVNETTFDMCGDAQTDIEKNVPKSSVIAKVCAIYKEDVYTDVSDDKYKKNIIKLYSKKKYKRFYVNLKRKLYSIIKENKNK